MGKLWEFLKAVSSHWAPIMSGVLATVVLGGMSYLYEQCYGSSPLPWYAYVFVALAFVFYACYRTWLDQDHALLDRDHALLNRERTIKKLLETVSFQQDENLQEILVSLRSTFAQPEKLAYLRTQAHYLRLEVEKAAPEDQLMLIKRLEQTLSRQLTLDVFQRGSLDYENQFNAIIAELEALRDLVKKLKDQGVLVDPT